MPADVTYQNPPLGCRLDAFAYRWYRRELQQQYTAATAPAEGEGENERLKAQRQELAMLRTALLNQYARARSAETAPTASPARAVVDSDEEAPSQTFLCEATLREAGDATDTGDAVQRYLRQLNLPAPPAPRGVATASHCDTFTQDTDMSPSSGSAASDSSDGNGDAMSPTQAVAARKQHLPDASPSSPGDFAGASQGSWARINAVEDDERERSGHNPTSSFLFATTSHNIKAGIGRVRCMQFCPVATIGQRKPATTNVQSPASQPSADADSTLVACGTSSGDVWLLSVTSRGASVGDNICFSGHRDEVNDVHWSDDGRLLISASADATVAVWDVQRREKLREVNTFDPALCGRFLPNNNNFFIVGIASAGIRVFNLSTGIQVKKVKVSDPVHALAMDDEGLFAFTASAKGVVQAFAILLDLGQIRKVSTLLLGPERQLGAITWQAGHGVRPLQHASGLVRMTRCDYLAANVADAVLVVAFTRTFRAQGETSANFYEALRTGAWCALRVLRSIPSHSTTIQRSIFCERPSEDSHLVVACGTEDGCVDLWSCTAARSDKMVMLSPGYPCAPLCIAWDASDSVIAVGTDTGDVITWRRYRISGGDAVDAAFQRSVAAGGPGRESSVGSRDDASDAASSHHDQYSESSRAPTSLGTSVS